MPYGVGAAVAVAAHRFDGEHAQAGPLFGPSRVKGDDFIQQNLGNGTVDQDAFTHGSSEQRQKWFMTGYETGDPRQCDTFATADLG